MEPVIRSLTIQNLLSFGEEATTIDLLSLNVLIGPNGSGKSNLIEVLGLLQNAPKELATAISNGGPIEDWLWKGGKGAKAPTASVETILSPHTGQMALRYRLAFTKSGFRFAITDELIENEHPFPGEPRPLFYYSFGKRLESINPHLSILAQRKDPEHYPEITYLGDLFAKFRLYRDWEFGTLAGVREPSDAGLPSDYLAEDGSNLGVVLDRALSDTGFAPHVL